LLDALMAMMEVDRRGQDAATVVIAVGVGDINLALRKPATESSTYTREAEFVLVMVTGVIALPTVALT
jgi:hypothetical protein